MNLPLRHLISLESLDRPTVERLLDRADGILAHGANPSALAGRTVLNLFFEPSTRTRTSFELAARRLGAIVVNFDTAHASTSKGETLLDTLHTLEAMDIDVLVVRHRRNGTPHFLAEHATSDLAVINAGDGNQDHPSQGLLDLLTIRQQRQEFGNLVVTICGDIAHSRVARSDIHALRAMGVREIRLCGPRHMLPEPGAWPDCRIDDDFDAAIRDSDVVIMLRLQIERMSETEVPERAAYFARYGLDERRLGLAARGCLVLHPGPINRHVEIAPAVADGPQSQILRQVRNGVAMRMAILMELLQLP